jgi:hypothetical protein
MRTKLLSRLVLSSRLPSLCLRYGLAKTSLWLRRSRAKLQQFNNFHSDSPLYLSSFGPRYCGAPERLYVYPFSISFGCIEFAGRPLIRAAVLPPRASHFAHELSSASSLKLIVPHECPSGHDVCSHLQIASVASSIGSYSTQLDLLSLFCLNTATGRDHLEIGFRLNQYEDGSNCTEVRRTRLPRFMSSLNA